MNFLTKLRAWSYRRQWLEAGAETLTDALRHTIGVYSSHPSAPLSLWARTKPFSADAFRALEREQAAVRIPAWRGSIFLMAAQDARLAMAFHEPVKMGAAWYKYMGMSEAEVLVLQEQVIAAATHPMLPKALRAATGVQEEKIASIARHAAYAGHILRIGSESLRANALKYVSTAAWLPKLLEPMEQSIAWQEVAQRYFATYGPARVEDFRWWIGTTKNQAALVVTSLDVVDIGEGLLLLRDDLPAFEQTQPLPDDAIAILPKWDSYTMALAGDGRARLIASEHQARGYTGIGDGLGLVLVGGQAAAAWHHNFSGTKMRVELDIFDRTIQPHMAKVQEKFEDIARLLDGKSCDITIATEPLAPRLDVLRKRHTKEE